MDDFSTHLKTVYRISLIALFICIFCSLIFPHYSAYFFGMIVGITVSMINSYYLSLKIKQVANSVIQGINRRVNMGFFTRTSMAMLAVIASLKYEQIEFSTTLGGLFFTQVVTLVVGIVSNLRRE